MVDADPAIGCDGPQDRLQPSRAILIWLGDFTSGAIASDDGFATRPRLCQQPLGASRAVWVGGQGRVPGGVRQGHRHPKGVAKGIGLPLTARAPDGELKFRVTLVE